MTGDSRRALTPELHSPFPLGEALPAVYQEDGLVQRWTAALDDVLAPVFATLDNLSSYLDPKVAPEDFVRWLATWVGITLHDEPDWSSPRARALVSGAAELYRWRGTVRGLQGWVRLAFGATPEVVESGGCVASETARAAPPGSAVPSLVVRLRVEDPQSVDVALLRRLVDAARPAHVPAQVEVVANGALSPGAGSSDGRTPSGS